VRSTGTGGNDTSQENVISGNGRLIAFESRADNLVPNDENEEIDVFVHDRQTGKTRRVSVSSAEEEADGQSYEASISGNGRWVAFTSTAPLSAADKNGAPDIYLRDRKTGKTKRVSVASDGSEGDDYSEHAEISASGRFVAFRSAAGLVGSDDNGSDDVYVRDRKTRKTRLVSLDSDGQQTSASDTHDDPFVSSDGRFVMWYSNSATLVPNDENKFPDIFVRDRKRGRTTRVTLDSQDGEIAQGGYDASMSANGRFIAFESEDDEIVPNDGNPNSDIFVRDRVRGTTKRASVWEGKPEPNDFVGYPRISDDGRFVSFCTPATNVDRNFSGDDLFVRDMKGRTTKLISVPASEDGHPNGNCYSDLSVGSRWVVWESGKQLVPSDQNDIIDVYFRGPLRWR
jgi:Tol biopolymer transport system component